MIKRIGLPAVLLGIALLAAVVLGLLSNDVAVKQPDDGVRRDGPADDRVVLQGLPDTVPVESPPEEAGGEARDDVGPEESLPYDRDAITAYLEDALAKQPSKGDQLSRQAWWMEASKGLPGGVLALARWVAEQRAPLSDAMHELVGLAGALGMRAMPVKHQSALRDDLIRSLEGDPHPTWARWRIWNLWYFLLWRFKEGPPPKLDLAQVERTARRIASDEPEHEAAVLAGAARHGCRSEALFQDLLRHVDAGEVQILRDALETLRENVSRVPRSLVTRLVAGEDDDTRYAGLVLLLAGAPGDADALPEALRRHPLDSPNRKKLLAEYVKRHGPDAVSRLPDLLASTDEAPALAEWILSLEATGLDGPELARRLRDGTAGWDAEQKRIVLYK